jgi:cation transport ATPase
MVKEVARSKAKPDEPKEEEPQAPSAPASAPAPPQRERYEKQEKREKQEKHEKHEKQEKQGYEKGEKHEKRGWSIWGSVLGGILLIFFGVAILFADYYSVPSWIWWPIFLIIIGIAIMIYVIAATSMTRRTPRPA